MISMQVQANKVKTECFYLPRRALGQRITNSAATLVGLLAIGSCLFFASMAAGQETNANAGSGSANKIIAEPIVKVWEFAPYEVDVRYAFDASVSVSPLVRQRFVVDLENHLDRTFQAAWQTTLTEMSPELIAQVTHNFDQLTLDDLTTNELVLVLATKHPDTKVLRTFEAAVEGLPQIATYAKAKDSVASAVASMRLEESSLAAQLLNKLSIEQGGLTVLQEQLAAGTIPAALLPRYAIDSQHSDVRSLVTLLPWQTETLLRQRDKLFFLIVSMDGDRFVFRTREIDCPMQFVGPKFESSTFNWPSAARMAGHTLVQSFAPIARVEEAETKSSVVRHRAGGMIVEDSNPARIHVGDVLQPIVRRDDRNGIPVLLEPLSFTFAAVTASDGVKMECNVYTYSGGPGLQGRQNRRTQRVLLRVRPIGSQSDLKIVVRGDKGRSQAGCFVYDRHLLTEDFELLGRTDWRGQLTINSPEEAVGVLPEAIRAARFQAKMEADRKRREQEEAARIAAEAAKNGEAADNAVEPPPSAAVAEVTTQPSETTTSPDEAIIPLNAPLVFVYIKSGDSVLAKLPMVPGLQELEVAELRDDSLRLQSEAFVRGFQGEILDLIGLRNLLAARVQLYIKEEELDKAELVLNDLRQLRSYNEMRDELSAIQRRILDASGDNVPRAARSQIDRMFQITRDMLQKYLQDELVANTEREFDNAKKGS